nr:hypothetical protein [Rhodococcus sp. (in: high G+C Gram-positive bacteria)]
MVIRHAENRSAYSPADALPDVGLYVDDDRSIAAVSHPSRANPSLHVASLHRTVLYVHSDGTASLGGTDDQDAAEFTGYVDSDETSGLEPGELVAMTMRCLLVEVATSIGTDPSLLAAAATFPARWTAEQVSDVRSSMNRYGLDHVALVSEAEALTAWSESTQATWAGSDSGIAAARGAASIATYYPVDAVTEKFPIATPARTAQALWMRTPVLVAVAVAAFLALGGGVVSLMLTDSTAPAIPTIESAPIADPTTAAALPADQIPFPTVVPIVELLEPASIAETVDPVPSTPEQSLTDDPTTELPRTRPAADTSEQPDRTVEVPVKETPTTEVPTEENPGGESDENTGGDTGGESGENTGSEGSGDTTEQSTDPNTGQRTTGDDLAGN